VDRPGVALLSTPERRMEIPLIGQTDALLSQMPINYLGRIVPVEATRSDVHVIVTDGFTGNLLMKTYEATVRATSATLRQELKRDPRSMLGGMLIRPGVNRLRQRIDPAKIGGAPLLGVDGVVIVAHGSSSAEAIQSAIRQAIEAVDNDLVGLIQRGMRDLAQVDFSVIEEG
jgi:glycerol-3-phosphate acyltransferase PlsX